MDLEKIKKEIALKEDILNFFSLFGLKDDVKHIISETNKNPTITFEATTKEDLKRILQLVKPSLLDFYKESNGTTGFNPILPTELNYLDEKGKIKSNCVLSKGKFKIDTESDKYNSNQEFKIVCFLERDKNRYFTLWIDTKLDFFKKYWTTEIIKDTHETEKAREYNRKHKDIYTTRPVFNNLETVKFWGGHVSHFATTTKEKNLINKMLEVE